MNQINLPNNLSPELAEETGWHLGDGSMNYYKKGKKIGGFYQLRGHKVDDVEHYKKVIKPLFNEIYNLDVSLRHMPSTGVFGFQLWSDEIVRFKNKKLNLPLGKKGEIAIPDKFMRKQYLLKSVLRGLFDTDGCLYLGKTRKGLYPRIKITTTSNILSEQIKIKLNILGMRATKYTTKRENPNWKPLQNIEVRGEKYTYKWFKMINPNNPKFIKRYQYFLDNS